MKATTLLHLAVLLVAGSLALGCALQPEGYRVYPLSYGGAWAGELPGLPQPGHPATDGEHVVWTRSAHGTGRVQLYLADIRLGWKGVISGPLRLFTEIDQPCVRDGHVVWSGREASSEGHEIYHFDTATMALEQVTHNDWDDLDPRIDAGRIVWTAKVDGEDEEIFFYDTASGEVLQLTDNDIDDYDPMIKGDHLLWAALTPRGTSLRLYEISTASLTELPTGLVTSYDFFDLGASKVVWAAQAEGILNDIFCYDIPTASVTRLTDTETLDERCPRIDGSRVLWTYQGHGIVLYDLENGSRSTIWDACLAEIPRIEDGKIIWAFTPSKDLYQYDIATDRTTRLTYNGNINLVRIEGYDACNGVVTWVSDLETHGVTLFSMAFVAVPECLVPTAGPDSTSEPNPWQAED